MTYTECNDQDKLTLENAEPAEVCERTLELLDGL